MEKPLRMEIDLKPALDAEMLHKRILRDFEESQNRQFKNAVGKLFPAKLVPVMVQLSGIPPELTRLRDYDEAIITKGGIGTKEIDPKTMESKLMKGVYFAGEVLDLDGLTGGFNLQIAWSTGYAAGKSIK